MQRFAFSLVFVALTFFCWGVYGPTLHEGQHEMTAVEDGPPSSIRPFICVGLAYFAIAVIVPIGLLLSRGEAGRWTFAGAAWSLASGVAGAVGALGIILAFKFGGKPVYVMPLVFGGAPVVNTLVNAAMTRTFREAGTLFYAAILLVAFGAAGVMFFKPTVTHVPRVTEKVGKITIRATSDHDGVAEDRVVEYDSVDKLKENPADFKVYQDYVAKLSVAKPMTAADFAIVMLSIGLTALCWGAYGPVLHKGQSYMAGSRLRPLLCVGLAYFAIAVVPPLIYLQAAGEPGAWTFSGTVWSLAAGTAGAVGALGIILAFTFGGKPIYVMPLVFGGAPVVNTFATLVPAYLRGERPDLNVLFFASLGLVVLGAVAVLYFAPRPAKPHGPVGDAKDSPGDGHQPFADEEPAKTGRERFEEKFGDRV